MHLSSGDESCHSGIGQCAGRLSEGEIIAIMLVGFEASSCNEGIKDVTSKTIEDQTPVANRTPLADPRKYQREIDDGAYEVNILLGQKRIETIAGSDGRRIGSGGAIPPRPPRPP